MADSYHIIDGQVVPYCGGRKCNGTDAWRDATPLELQLQEQLEESEHAIAAQAAEIEALRAEVARLNALIVRPEHSLSAEANRHYARAERLAEAIKAYKSEWDNPVKDYLLRAKRRDEMFALLREQEEEK